MTMQAQYNEVGPNESHVLSTTPTLQPVHFSSDHRPISIDISNSQQNQSQVPDYQQLTSTSEITSNRGHGHKQSRTSFDQSTTTQGAIAAPNIQRENSNQQKRDIGLYQPPSTIDSFDIQPLSQKNQNSFRRENVGLVHCHSAYGEMTQADALRKKMIVGGPKTGTTAGEANLLPCLHSMVRSSAPVLPTTEQGAPQMSRNAPEQLSSSHASAMADLAKLAVESQREATSLGDRTDPSEYISSKQPVSKLDQSFNQLMEQNQKLEQEIKDMNEQLSTKQNGRITAAQINMPQKFTTPNQASGNISEVQEKPRQESGTQNMQMSSLQSSFDQRCKRTRAIVTELAQRLNEVKRDASTELDRIQTRPSRGDNSQAFSTQNSNSRSPNQQSSIIQQRQGTIQINQATDLSRSQSPARRFPTQCPAATEEQANSNTIPEVMNFKQLKPQDSMHSSLDQPPQQTDKRNEAVNGEDSLKSQHQQSPSAASDEIENKTMHFGQEATRQSEIPHEQLCFDNSPVRSTPINSSTQWRKRQDDSDTDARPSFQKEQDSNFNRNPQSNNNQRFVSQKEQQKPAGTADKSDILGSPQQHFLQEHNAQNQTLGPDRSPLNVNGAQLSNILQQINHGGNGVKHPQGTNLIDQQQDQFHSSTISPSMARNQQSQGPAAYFLSEEPEDNTMSQKKQNKTPGTTPQQRQKGLSASYVVMGDQASSNTNLEPAQQSIHERLNSEEAFNQIATRNNNLIQTVLSSEQLSGQTYDKMHIEIMQLQDKIKFLEAQMVTSPSVSGDHHLQSKDDQKRGGQESTVHVSIDSNGFNAPYRKHEHSRHDSKHEGSSANHFSQLKMTVPKTVIVQPISQDGHQKKLSSRTAAGVIPFSEVRDKMGVSKKNQQDEKVAAIHRQILSQPEVKRATAGNEVPYASALQGKCLSQAQRDSLSQLNEHQQRLSAGNLVKVSETHRDKTATTPLQSEMNDDMSRSQPELTHMGQKTGRSQCSGKLSRKSSIRSARKSPLSKSQNSRQRERSEHADKKTITKRDKQNNNTKSQLVIHSRKLSKTKNRNSSLKGKGPENTSVSFKEDTEEGKDTRIQKSRHESQLTDPYLVTYSDRTAPSELISHREAEKNHSSMASKMTVQMHMQAELQNPSQAVLPQSETQEMLHMVKNDSLSLQVSTVTPSQNYQQSQGKSQKQTFPLRVRKNQTFAKGPDCPSIPSQSTGAADHLVTTSQDLSEINPPQESQSMDPQHYSSHDLPKSMQEEILREYQEYIQQDQDEDRLKSRRNQDQHVGPTQHGLVQVVPATEYQQQKSQQSELSQVKSAMEVTEYLFHPQSHQQAAFAMGDGPNGASGVANSWTNQTSRFQLLGSPELAPDRKDDSAAFTFKRGRSDGLQTQSNVLEDSHGDSRRTPNLDQTEAYASDQETEEDNDEEEGQTTDDQNDLVMKQAKFRKAKAKLNKDLPFQTQFDEARIKPETKSPEDRLEILEQQNRNLEFELRRHQARLAEADELHQKYKCLKLDYKQMLQSFERSEEIRREQKELINEQRQQMKHLKQRIKKQDTRMSEMMRDLDVLKLATSSNNATSVVDFSRVQTANHSFALRNNRVEPLTSQAMSGHAYQSGSSASHSHSRQSSQLSSKQLGQSQLRQSENYMVASAASSNYGLRQGKKAVVDLPRQYPQPQQLPQHHQEPAIVNSYALSSNGATGMLASGGQPGSDLLMADYSCLYDLTTSGDQSKILASTKRQKKKRHHRSRSASHSDRSRRKKSQKKTKQSRRHSGKKHFNGATGSRSASGGSTKRRSKSSRKRAKYQEQAPEDMFSLDQSYASSAKPPRDARRPKRNSRSKRRQKHAAEALQKSQAGYIVNIQTEASDVIKGIHKYQSQKHSLDLQRSQRQHSKRDIHTHGGFRPRSPSNRKLKRVTSGSKGASHVIHHNQVFK